MLALLVLPQNLPHQRGFRLPGAFGLSLQPDQQTLGQFHRQRFHARHGNTGLAGCRYRLVPADGRLGWRHDGREGKRIWTGFEADHFSFMLVGTAPLTNPVPGLDDFPLALTFPT